MNAISGQGKKARHAPPLRAQMEQETLWKHLMSGYIPMVASDHSPCPPELKETGDFFEA